LILLDTHIWIRWVDGSPPLPPLHRSTLQHHRAAGLAVSAISCWEVAKLVQVGRLALRIDVRPWLDLATSGAGIAVLERTPEVAVESTRLPGTFHRDPADQIIVATSRILGCPLITMDQGIRTYPHVTPLP